MKRGQMRATSKPFPSQGVLCARRVPPTVKGNSRIEASFEEGDKRRYNVPCPHCGVRQVLLWKNVKWDDVQPFTSRDV